MIIRALAALLLACASGAQAELLPNDYDKMSYSQALQRVRAEPQKHVMLYFGLETFCPPCTYSRGLLTGSTLKALYQPNYLVVLTDLREPGDEGRKVVAKYKVRWAPTILFLDAQGRKVADLRGGFKNEREAILTHEFVSQKLYAKSDLAAYVKANFNASGAQRVVPETKAAQGAPADDRPRYRDVQARRHERIAGDDLRKLLPGMRMEKENQDWFLTLHLRDGGALEADGVRKDGRGKARGPGKWYVTKKGKLCLEVKAVALDETWCRHVFRIEDGNYYYAVKDLRPDRVAYRFTLERA